MARQDIMKANVLAEQYCFPWFSNHSKRASTCIETEPRRSNKASLQHLRWPPQRGEKIAFETDFGVQIGILREIRQGLVWVDYIMEDDRIVPEDKLIMCPDPTPWRDPDAVIEEERKAWADRIRAKLGADIRQDPVAWEDFCHYVMFVLLEVRKRGKEAIEIPLSPAVQ